MAKGQKRSTREVKKPKLKKATQAASKTSGIMTKGVTLGASTPNKKT